MPSLRPLTTHHIGADRDNNHAWQVVLDKQGHGRDKLFNRAAKVYRKTFSIQPDSLGCCKHKDERVPPWLAGRNFMDVTGQYLETTDVVVHLEAKPPKDARFAYICVFNGGEWKAIHWGKIENNQVTFTKMGRNIVYLPAYYVDQTLVPSAAAFILALDGQIRTLDREAGPTITIEMAVTTPETPDADTHIERPRVVVKPGRDYELFVWDDGWKSLGKQKADEQPVLFESVPSGGLLWLVEEDSRRLERIFTIEAGRHVFW